LGIGNGVHTRILTDNWISAVRPDQITTITPLPQGATMSTLIDLDTGAWDSDVIKSFFDDVTAAKILQIPLS
jgi:hypothetical protein